MATGHINPGYGRIASGLRRYQRGLETDTHDYLGQAGMGRDEADLDLNSIRDRAREAWLKPDCSSTTYGHDYRNKMVDMDELAKTRPTSAQRKNNPHPPMVFLSTRLHYVPGYHNPDAGLDKHVYRVDASVPYEEQAKRMNMKSKYMGRPSTGAMNQHKEREDLRHFEDPLERQAAEAWIKLANDKDKEDMIKNGHYRIPGPVASHTCRAKTIPSLHRHMREAGAGEADTLRVTVGSRKFNDIEKTRNVTYTHKSKRGDFLMHPEWPPSMTQHRLSGLSSSDIPYIPGRR